MAKNTTAAAPKKPSVFVRLSAYVRPYRWLFVLAFTLTIVMSVLAVVRPALIQRTVDGPMSTGDVQGLHWWMIAITAVTVLQAILQYLQVSYSNLLGQNVLNDLRQQVYGRLMQLRLRYFDKTPVGALQTRTINDIETLSAMFTQNLVTIVGEMLQLVGIIGYMLYMDWRMALVVFTVVPLIILATWVFKARVAGAFNRVRKAVSEMNTYTQEHISGVHITQLYNREETEYKTFTEINTRHKDANVETILYYSIFFPVIEILSALALALLVWYGAGRMLEDAGVTKGELMGSIIFIQMFFRPIRQLADQFNSLQLGLVSGQRVFEILDNDDMTADQPSTPEALAALNRPVGIQFQDIHFGYNEEQQILKGLSFDVEPGTTTAIVGATGSGKSTCMNILLRFYDWQQGQVLVNGVDSRQFSIADLRSAMGLVLQDVYLFSGTIYDNITLNNPDIPLERVQECARLIGADEFIERLPGGYHYQVGERGLTLSTGQRQLLAFVRVLAYNPKVLLLDEATANIDAHSEYLIQQAIAIALEGRTAIIIAHRLSTIQHARQILVMRKGEIVERGNHPQLLELNGYYARLHRLQFEQEVVS